MQGYCFYRCSKECNKRIFLDNLPLGTCYKCNEYSISNHEEFICLKLVVPCFPYSVQLSFLIENYYNTQDDQEDRSSASNNYSKSLMINIISSLSQE